MRRCYAKITSLFWPLDLVQPVRYYHAVAEDRRKMVNLELIVYCRVSVNSGGPLFLPVYAYYPSHLYFFPFHLWIEGKESLPSLIFVRQRNSINACVINWVGRQS